MRDEQRLRTALHAASAHPPAPGERFERLRRRRRHQQERRGVVASALAFVALAAGATVLGSLGHDTSVLSSSTMAGSSTPSPTIAVAPRGAPSRVASRPPARAQAASVPPSSAPVRRPPVGPSRSSAVRPTSPRSAEPPAALIREDFSSAEAAGRFTVRGGRWAVAGGGLRVLESEEWTSSGNANTAVHDTRVDGRAVVQATLRVDDLDTEWGDVSLLFGYQDPRNYFYLSLNERDDSATSGVFRVVDGLPQELANSSATIRPGRLYAVRVELGGTGIRAYLDGRLIAQAGATVPAGRVGVGSRDNAVTADTLLVTG